MNLKWHSVTWQYTMTTHYWSVFIPSRDLITELDLPNFERFPLKNICDGCDMQTGDAYSYGTWSRPFGTCICSTCWDQPLFRTCHDFSDSALRTSLGTLSFCACHIRRYHNASNILFSLANQVRRFVHGAINSNASLSYEVSFRLRITDEGSVPEMRIWSILLI